MDPSLVVLIVAASLITLVGMPWVIFWGIARLRAQKAGGASMRRSELEAVIAAAVAEANAPVLRRLETLEALATDDDAPAGRLDPAVLADALEPDDADDLPAARRRARS